MYINKKDLLLYESREDRIPSVGLRKLNLLGYNDNNNNYNSPNKSVLKKGLSNKKLLFNIKSPKTLYHPKNINSPIIPSFSFSFSQSKGSNLVLWIKHIFKDLNKILFLKICYYQEI